MTGTEVRELLALLDKQIDATAGAAKLAETIGVSNSASIRDSALRNGQLLTEAHDLIVDLAIRCGILMPPRTARLSDLVNGREIFELGQMERFALALGNVTAVFREDGARLGEMARALRFEAETLEAESREDQRRAGEDPLP